MKTKFWATRSSRTDNPIRTPIHDIEYPKANKNRKPRKIFTGPLLGRQPTRNPTRPITIRVTTFCKVSPTVRPITTADLEIGSDLKRSIKPFCISAAKPTAVAARVNATVCTKIPGINN